MLTIGSMANSDSVRGEMRRNIIFYITVVIFFAVGAVLNRVFFTPVWTIIVPGVEIFIGIPSLIAVFYMFRVLSRIPKGSVERTILIFVGLTALSLAIAGMHLTRTLHPPGGATALIAVIGGDGVHSLGYGYVFCPVLVGAVLMLLVGLIVNNISNDSGRHYPAYWL